MLRAVISHEPGTGGTFFGTRSPEGTERSQKKSQKPSAAHSCSCRQAENKDRFSICPRRMALPTQGRWQPAQPLRGASQKQDAAGKGNTGDSCMLWLSTLKIQRSRQLPAQILQYWSHSCSLFQLGLEQV